MNQAVIDCLIEDYEDLIPTLNLPDPDDRHVLAAAIKGGASLIVTINLKDFPANVLEKFDIEAQHPDDFISSQYDLNPPTACTAIKKLRLRLQNPAKTTAEYLETIERQGLPRTADLMKHFDNLL